MRACSLTALGGLLVLVSGCSNTDDPGADPVDINGTWTFVIDVTQAQGSCEGEEINGPGDPSSTQITVSVTPAPSNPGRFLVTMSGFLGNPAAVASTIRDEVRIGSVIAATGTWPEDGGSTTATFSMEVISANEMEGREVWDWSFDGSVECPLGLSDVTATRN